MDNADQKEAVTKPVEIPAGDDSGEGPEPHTVAENAASTPGQRHPKPEPPRRFHRFAAHISDTRKITTDLFILILLLFLAAIIYKEAKKDTVLIEPFEVTKSLEEKGYTSHVMASGLADQINLIAKRASTRRKSKTFALSFSDTLPEIEVPKTHLTLQSIIRYIQEFFGNYPTRISGEATLNSQGDLHLVVRVISHNEDQIISETHEVKGKLGDMDSLLLQEGQHVLRYVEPFTLAAYLYNSHQQNPTWREECLNLLQYCIYKGPHAFKDKITKQRLYSKDAPWAYDFWAGILYDERDYDGALDKCRQALDLDPNFTSAYNTWGNILYDKREYKEAIDKYKQAKDCDEDYSPIYSNWGDVLTSKRDFEGAIAKYKKAIELDANNLWAYIGWGNVFYEQGDYQGAIEKHKVAVEIDPDNPWPYINWGNALYNMKNYDGALAKYRKALDLNPNLSDAYSGWGEVLNARSNYDQAIAKFDKAVKLDPGSSWPYTGLGYALKAKGKYPEARAKYRKAIDLNPDDPWPYYGMGELIYKEQGSRKEPDYREALDNFRKAIDLKPNAALAYNGWGNVLFSEKDYVGAIERYKKAIEYEPSDSVLYSNLGDALSRKGDYEEALANYKRAIELEPNDRTLVIPVKKAIKELMGKLKKKTG
ncbi:MAG TPA: tetratricopeptide repeat protein [Blastocatellia bacterium]|nr:tetratricopeptide repeat protein [Blastocatellia bacterium]